MLAIVEVKRHGAHLRGGRTPQIERYKRLGPPVFGLAADFGHPHRLAKTISQIPERTAVPLKEIEAMTHLKRERMNEKWLAKRARLAQNLNIRGSE